MRLVKLSKWEFDLPNNMVLTLHDREGAEWLDGVLRELEKVRSQRYALLKLLEEARPIVAETQTFDGHTVDTPSFLLTRIDAALKVQS